MEDIKQKHTPGPWHIDRRANGDMAILRHDESNNCGDIYSAHLAVVNPLNRDFEAEANARLIAVAPKMYSSIKFILNDKNSTLDPEARLILSDAISKVEEK